MTDIFSEQKRSVIMSHIRSKDMMPELFVRSLAHRLGYRFRLHYSGLPGHPDLVFPKHRKVIFVHGCFWHLHHCRDGHIPKSRSSYWEPKLRGNAERDKRVREDLKNLGWDVLVVWECELETPDRLETVIKCFLEQKKTQRREKVTTLKNKAGQIFSWLIPRQFPQT